MQRIFVAAAALAIALAACRPSTPLPSPTEIEATSLAQANATLTPLAASTRTPRFIPGAPTLGANSTPLAALETSSSSPTSTSVVDPQCNRPLDVADAAVRAHVLVKNNTNSPMVFAMGLARPNIFGQCGYISWPDIPAGDSVTAVVPQVFAEFGDPCYWVNAWIKDPRHKSSVSDGGFCIDTPRGWVINVNYDKIRLKGQ